MSNGTRALIAARPAAAVGVAGFANLDAAAAWALEQGRSIVVVCAGELGGRSMEDEACAGLLVERVLQRRADAEVGASARAAVETGRPYAADPARLGQDSPHARRLTSRGRGPDVAACLELGRFALVPIYRADVDKVVSPYR